jgi:hypothetical protein
MAKKRNAVPKVKLERHPHREAHQRLRQAYQRLLEAYQEQSQITEVEREAQQLSQKVVS